jgi:methionyl-tRNA synthetase
MPDMATEISKQLGLSLDFTKPLLTEPYASNSIVPGTKVQKGAALLSRIETKPQGAKTVSNTPIPSQPTTVVPTPTAVPPAPTPSASSPAPLAPAVAQITIDEFMKIQLKTAKVISAERVPKSEKLLKLQVAVGTEQRQIVAGIGKKYEPETLIGKTIVIIANLKPAKLMGIESQGMVLAAGDSEVRGLITILEEVEPGTKVK